MSRQLSTFLADASLALDASDSLEEMLRLVAEQARELVGAECCVATVAMDGQPRAAEAISFDRGRSALGRLREVARPVRDLQLHPYERGIGEAVRRAAAGTAAFRLTRRASVPLEGWLAAALTALDGSELGAIQLFDKQDGAFTGDDEAVLVHLAQMASAAVERTRLYHEHG